MLRYEERPVQRRYRYEEPVLRVRQIAEMTVAEKMLRGLHQFLFDSRASATTIAQELIQEDEYEKFFNLDFTGKRWSEIKKMKTEVILREARNIEIKRNFVAYGKKLIEHFNFSAKNVSFSEFFGNNPTPTRTEMIEVACKALSNSGANLEVCDNMHESTLCNLVVTPLENKYILVEMKLGNLSKWYPGTAEQFLRDKAAQRRVEMRLRKFFSKIGNNYPIEEIVASLHFCHFQDGNDINDFIDLVLSPEQQLKATVALPAPLAAYYYENQETLQEKMKNNSQKLDLPARLMRFHSAEEQDQMELLSSYIRTQLEDEDFPSVSFTAQQIEIHTILKLSPQDFDSRGDFDFPNNCGKILTRGNMEYCQPNDQWSRLGFRVLDLYPDGNEWIEGTNEWAVGFHGTGGIFHYNDQDSVALKSIMHSRQVLRAQINAYGGDIAENRSDPIPDPGIYFAKNVTECYYQTIESNGRKYDVALECRLHPDYVWVANEGRYLIVDAPHHVRPYGLLIREHDQEF